MGGRLLATAGNSVKLWDLQSYSLRQEIASENGRVQGLTWNQDGQCLASLGKTGDKISLSAVNAKSAANIGAVQGVEAPTCLKFASRSPHYLSIGNRNGAVAIWNVKTQSQKKAFSVTDGPIAQISFSHNDSHVAVASQKGSIYLLSVVYNSTAGPFKIFDNEAVTDLTYNCVKKPLLGCCSDRGSIALFDSHTNKVVHTFPTAHSSPVSSLLFSPVNELLMISTGYDKQFNFYNIQTKQPLITRRCSAPLTSAAFLADGQQVAFGTMTGQVFIHDLRMLHPPVAEISAHNTAVTNVLLQPVSRSRPENSTIGLKTVTRRNTDAATNQKLPKSCSDEPDDMNPSLKSKIHPPPASNSPLLDVFSPIRPTDPTTEVNLEEVLKNPPNFNVYGYGSAESLSINDVLSPVRSVDESTKRNFSPLSHKMPTHGIDIADLLSPYTFGRDGTSNSSLTQIKLHSEETVPPPAQNDKENMEPIILGQNPDVEMKEGTPDRKLTPVKSHKEDPLSPLHELTDPKVTNTSYTNQMTSKNLAKTFQQGTVICKPEKENSDEMKITNSSVHNAKTDTELTEKSVASPSAGKIEESDHITNTPLGYGILKNDCSTLNTPKTATSSKMMYSRAPPPKKRPLLRPIQASDLLQPSLDAVEATEENSSTTVNLSDRVKPCDNGVPQLQVELIRSCMAEVLEEFQDDMNRRLMHLQYVMTKKFLEQQELMEKLHRQYSLNEDLLMENERLRQENSHLKAKY